MPNEFLPYKCKTNLSGWSERDRKNDHSKNEEKMTGFENTPKTRKPTVGGAVGDLSVKKTTKNDHTKATTKNAESQ